MEKAPKPSAASTTWFGRRETSMNLTKKADPRPFRQILPRVLAGGSGSPEQEKKKKIQSWTQVQRYRYLDAALMPRLKLLLVVLCNQFLYVSQFIMEIFTSVLLFTVFWI